MKVEAVSNNQYNIEKGPVRQITSEQRQQLKNQQDVKVENFDDFFNKVGKEDFDTIVDGVKKVTSKLKTIRFEFTIHDPTKRVLVKIYDRATDDLVGEVPPEKFLDLIASIWNQAGLVVDKKV